MAVDANAYSPKQFAFLVAEQDDFGTHAADESSPNNDFLQLDVDSVGSPSLNVNQALEHRTGSRILQATDVFQDIKAKVIEIAVSGTANTETLDLLLSHITGDSSVPYAMASNVGGTTFTTATTNQTDQQIFSIVYRSPSSGNDLSFRDCFMTSITLSGDMGTEGGRIKYSATFKTGDVPELSAASLDAATLYSAGTQRDMTGWTLTTIGDIADTVMSNFTLNLEHDAHFLGFDTSGNPEVIGRGAEFSATLDAQIVYNVDSEALFHTYEVGAAFATSGGIICGNNATIGSQTLFGFHIDTTALTNAAYSEGDVMMVDTSWKALALDSGHLIEITCA